MLFSLSARINVTLLLADEPQQAKHKFSSELSKVIESPLSSLIFSTLLEKVCPATNALSSPTVYFVPINLIFPFVSKASNCVFVASVVNVLNLTAEPVSSSSTPVHFPITSLASE